MTEQELRSFIEQLRSSASLFGDATLGEQLRAAADLLEKTLPDADASFLREIADAYNQRCSTMPACTQLTDKRKSAIRARIKEDKARRDIGWWQSYFDYAAASDFLSGRKTDFKAGFDWLINKSNMVKVLEGNYQNRAAPTRGAKEQDSFLDSVSAEHARRTGAIK